MKLKKNALILIIVVAILSLFGLVAIGSATHIYDTNMIAKKFSGQQIWFFLGLILMSVFYFIDYELISRFYILAALYPVL